MNRDLLLASIVIHTWMIYCSSHNQCASPNNAVRVQLGKSKPLDTNVNVPTCLCGFHELRTFTLWLLGYLIKDLKVILKLIFVIGGWVFSCGSALRLMSMTIAHDKSTLFQIMAWCCQATSHYLNQCWPRFVSSYGFCAPQWVQQCTLSQNISHGNADKIFPAL